MFVRVQIEMTESTASLSIQSEFKRSAEEDLHLDSAKKQKKGGDLGVGVGQGHFGYGPRQKAFKMWALSDKSCVKVGLVDVDILCRISNEPDLADFERECDEDGKVVSKTVSLSYKQLIGLRNKVRWYSKTPSISKTDKLQGFIIEEEEERGFDSFSFLADTRPEISIENCITKVTTFEMSSNGDSCIPSGQVTLTLDELLVLNDVINNVCEFMNTLEFTYSQLSHLIRSEAGKCLSKMLFSKYGKFDREMVYSFSHCDSRKLWNNFLDVYGEFMGMGYTFSLVKKVQAEIQKYDILYDVLPLTFQVMYQVKALFSAKYLECPRS
jgi:hypothetical protein